MGLIDMLFLEQIYQISEKLWRNMLFKKIFMLIFKIIEENIECLLKIVDPNDNNEIQDLFHQVMYSFDGDLRWHARDLKRQSYHLRRLRVFDPEKFENNYKVKLTEIVEKYEKEFEKFKKTDRYTKLMPEYLDSDGTLGYQRHDFYYSNLFENLTFGIESLQKAINDPVVLPKGAREVAHDIYPLVFASSSLHTTGIAGAPRGA